MCLWFGICHGCNVNQAGGGSVDGGEPWDLLMWRIIVYHLGMSIGEADFAMRM